MLPSEQLLPWGSFQPDITSVNNQNTRYLDNVIPRGDGYGPFKQLTAYTDALASPCRGCFRAKLSDGSVALFAGTATKLYKLDNTTFSWDNVSKSTGGYSYSLTDDQMWQFAQYDDYVIAVQGGDAPQVFELGVSTYFADLGGSPPTAKYVTVLNEFVVLSGLTSFPYRIQWSGRSAPTTWTSGVSESDYQDMVDGGSVYTVAGGEQSAVLLQDYSMRRMTYQPGSPVIFSFERVSREIGIEAPYSLIQAGSYLFWFSNQGFQMSIDGNVPQPVGKEQVDNTFIAEWDDDNLQLMTGFIDPRGTRVYWGYKTLGNTSSTCNKTLVYDWALKRWSQISGLEYEYPQAMSNIAVTLEGLDDTVSIETTGNTTNTDATVNGIPDTSSIYAGMTVTGSGIPAGTTVSSITNSTTIELSANATATASGVALSFSGALDALPTSLDAFPVSFGREIAFFTTDSKLGFANGNTLEATLETPEVSHQNGYQMLVQGMQALCDAPTMYGQVSYRQHPGIAKTWLNEQIRNSEGFIPARIDTRMTAFRNRIPSGTVWTYSTGVYPQYVITGKR